MQVELGELTDVVHGKLFWVFNCTFIYEEKKKVSININ